MYRLRFRLSFKSALLATAVAVAYPVGDGALAQQLTPPTNKGFFNPADLAQISPAVLMPVNPVNQQLLAQLVGISPEILAAIAAAAGDPAQLLLVVQAAVGANPEIAAQIAGAAAQANPETASSIAAAVAAQVPQVAAAIAATVTAAVPTAAVSIVALVVAAVPTAAAEITATVIAVAGPDNSAEIIAAAAQTLGTDPDTFGFLVQKAAEDIDLDELADLTGEPTDPTETTEPTDPTETTDDDGDPDPDPDLGNGFVENPAVDSPPPPVSPA